MCGLSLNELENEDFAGTLTLGPDIQCRQCVESCTQEQVVN